MRRRASQLLSIAHVDARLSHHLLNTPAEPPSTIAISNRSNRLQVLAIMDESIQVYSPELLQNRIAILR